MFVAKLPGSMYAMEATKAGPTNHQASRGRLETLPSARTAAGEESARAPEVASEMRPRFMG